MQTQSLHQNNSERLQALWDLRSAGAVDSALAGWLAWCGELGLPSNSPIQTQAESLRRAGASAQEILVFALLGMSFLRNARRLSEMRETTDEILAWAKTENVLRSSALALQLGLNSMAEGNLARALEYFTEARRLAKNQRETLFALINSTICCEDLGLDFTRLLAEFEAALRGSEKQAWAASLVGQRDALRLRAAFKSGNGEELAKLVADAPLSTEQTHYYAAWLSQLASWDYPAVKESFFERVEKSGFTYLTGYRLRTLHCLLVKDDLEPSVRVGEKIERLYLWVWEWLNNPSPEILERALRVKQNLELDRSQQIGHEQYQLLRLSLRWLGLFAGIGEEDLAGSLRAWRAPIGAAIPHLEFESLVQDWIFALRSRSPLAADQRKMLEIHPARKLAHFTLPSLLKEVPHPRLRALSEALAGLGATEEAQRDGILVESLQGRLVLRSQGDEKTITSESLVKLVQQFRTNTVAPKSLLLAACFGIRRYDSFLHDPKIANLLSRANKELAPYAAFSTKGERVFAELNSVEWKMESAHTKTFLDLPEVWDYLLPQTIATTQEEPTPSLAGQWATRAQFETLLGMSRASANRWIATWLEKGLLEKEGAGKNTRYRAKESLTAEIEKLIQRTESP